MADQQLPILNRTINKYSPGPIYCVPGFLSTRAVKKGGISDSISNDIRVRIIDIDHRITNVE